MDHSPRVHDDGGLAGKAVRAFIIASSKKTMAAHSNCITGDLHGKYSLLLNVIVDSAAVDIDDFSGTGNPDDLYVFPATLAPDFITLNNGLLQFDHFGYVLVSGSRFLYETSQPSKCVKTARVSSKLGSSRLN